MKQQILNMWGMKSASEFNSEINKLPIAELKDISTLDGISINNFKAVMVNNIAIDMPTKYYRLVQHQDAFRPIIEGLTLSGEHNWNFQFKHNNKKAQLNLFTTSINDGNSDIFLGFSVVNSFNRSTTINYGISVSSGIQYIEMVGYRQVCSNGMKIRVPLEQADFIRPEQKQELKELIAKGFSFMHIRGVEQKILSMQYMVEAMALMKNPVLALIKKANELTLTDITKIEVLLLNHFSERVSKEILNKFTLDKDIEGNNLWSLYNAITNVASHNQTFRNSETILNQASELLLEVLQ